MKTNKLMITCALCGGGTTRKQSPYVPLTPEELVADSLAAVRAGACILHIHVRDDEGANTMETSRFVQVVSMIREALRPTTWMPSSMSPPPAPSSPRICGWPTCPS